MARYRRVLTNIWVCDDKFQNYSTEGKLLFLYLITNEHINESGIYKITYKTIANETDIPKERVAELIKDELSNNVSYDEENNVIFVHKFLKFNGGGNPKLLKKSIEKDKVIIKTTLWKEFNKYYAKDLKPLDNSLETVSKPLDNSLETVSKPLDNSLETVSQHTVRNRNRDLSIRSSNINNNIDRGIYDSNSNNDLGVKPSINSKYIDSGVKYTIAPNRKNDSKPSSKPPKITFNFETKKWENITSDDIQVWKDAYPACDVKAELRKMRAWLLANPDKRKKNYKRFIINWLSRQQDRGGTKRGSKSDVRPWEEIQAELEKDMIGK